MNNINPDEPNYPKSKNNLQCIGPCYPPGTEIVHPVLLDIVTNTQHPFCPVNEWEYMNPETKKIEMRITDVCYKATTDKISPREIEFNMLVPYIEFDSEQFLKIYYKIYSFEDGIDWIDTKKSAPINTKLRILNSLMKTFGSKIDIIDQRLVNFFIDVIKLKYMTKIFNAIGSYIVIDGQDVSLIDPDKNTSDINDRVVRINYIVTTFLDEDTVFKFLSRYFKHRKDSMNRMTDHIESIIIDFIEYIKNKINMSLNNWR